MNLAQAMRSSNFTHKTLTYARMKAHKEVRCTGKVRLWKNRPGWWEIPVKYGLRESFYITPDNEKDWTPSCGPMPDFDPAWATADVLTMYRAVLEDARRMNDYHKAMKAGIDSVRPERNFSLSKLLADALEDAGTDDARLKECRVRTDSRVNFPVYLDENSPIIIEIAMHKGKK